MTADEIRLEPQQPQHAPGLYAALQDPRIYHFLDDAPPVSVAAVRQRIVRLMQGGPPDGSEIWLNWVVFRGAVIVGYTQATIEEKGCASIAYVLTPAVWGTGVAQTAVTLMLAELAGRHGISRAVADTETGNRASQGLLVRLGFTRDRRAGGDIFYSRAM